MLNNIIVRKIKLNDYNSFLKLINDFRETNFTIEQFENTLHTINNNSDIIVLEYNNELIGTGTIIYEYKFIFNISCLAHIEDVCIKKEYRNKGLGIFLINELIKFAELKKCYKITLDCSDLNIGFYKKCKFEKRGNQMSMLLPQSI
jgi:glucosamine-phosphate N-acetyltransferase